ncbi:hypothetical protein [Dictyobacter formicarum]|uniref:Uncharacterized protein n=1 Tax=Dictyobacter formicarum TaxID=2778368 RepID=A0ABQ3VS72_9CHLR|nr:hypothetical protein [Dictyobacter formicarum]GHO88233.1 hypothetical protein KSZ_62390 [Dictyobacter formicarum]
MTQTFTLLFPHGEIAVLEVSGAQTQDEARSIAASVLLPCKYEVQDGDVSHGHAFCFYSWANVQAQEPQRGQSQREEAHV